MRNLLATKPASPPGEKFAYSNVGYTIAGAMAEKVTGLTWEDLVKREVFEPLELTGAGSARPRARTQRSNSREVTVCCLAGKFR